MISVSGLHVAVLAEAVVLVLLVAGANVRRAEGIAVVVVAIFVVFVGAPAPAVRSGAMFAALVATRRLQRPTSPWALLALGGLVPLADPRVASSIGYQLSVVGMAGLVASGQLVRRLPGTEAPPWVARLGRETLATVVASLATAPIVAWHFGRVSLAAPVTNLAAAPLFALAQPALFLSLVIAPIEPAARLVADGTSVLLAAIGRVGDLGAALPGAAIDVTPTAVTGVFSAAAAAAFLVSCTAHHWIRPALVGGVSVALALWWPFLPARQGRLEIHVLDVGQGDAIAVRTPRNRWIVMDAGNAWGSGDAGTRVVVPHLRRRGGEVAALILSHPHTDHVGGVPALLRALPVQLLLDGGFVHTSDAYAATMTSARERRVPWRVARAGDSLRIDGVRLLILAPDSVRAMSATEANEASVMALLEWRGVRVLLTGDAERAEEARAQERYRDALRADILKVGHHGSATSTGESFLDAVRPRIAVVSVGAGNRYGHPSAAVMESLAARGVAVLRTDEDGTTIVSTDGSKLWVRTEEGRWGFPAGGPGQTPGAAPGPPGRCPPPPRAANPT
jgi:competence protein ComEC